MKYVSVNEKLISMVIATLNDTNIDGTNSYLINELLLAMSQSNVDTTKLSALVSRNL